jgi:enolase
LIKPIQIGTLSETIQAFRVAKKAGKKAVVATRSGETGDKYLAHLAVGINSDYIKCGAPSGGERTAKYNELLRISESLQNDKIN